MEVQTQLVERRIYSLDLQYKMYNTEELILNKKVFGVMLYI